MGLLSGRSFPMPPNPGEGGWSLTHGQENWWAGPVREAGRRGHRCPSHTGSLVTTYWAPARWAGLTPGSAPKLKFRWMRPLVQEHDTVWQLRLWRGPSSCPWTGSFPGIWTQCQLDQEAKRHLIGWHDLFSSLQQSSLDLGSRVG